MKNLLYILPIAILLLQSCKEEALQQPEILEKYCAFDLEKIDFQENVPLLYSKHIMVDDTEYDSITDGKLTDEMLKYKLENIVTQTLGLTIPEEDFGYHYVSPTLDSVARFQKIYFKNLSVLTDKNKKAIAFYAESVFDNLKDRKSALDNFNAVYGYPKYSFCTDHQYNQCSYEWDLQDRTIQIVTFNGTRTSISTFDGISTELYYSLDILIVDNNSKKALNDVHIFEYSEDKKYEHDGKYYTYKELGLSKKEIHKDNFFLYSSDEKYLNDEYGVYDIQNAREE